MKNCTTKIFALVAFLLVSVSASFAQQNPNANPLVSGLLWNPGTVKVGQTGSFTIKFGQNGSDPIPANTVNWTLNVPDNLVTLGTPTIPAPFYIASNNVSGNTRVIIIKNNAVLPKTTILAPQDSYEIVWPFTGKAVGGPTQASLNSAIVATALAQVGNLNPGDDNANAPVIVTAAIPVKLANFTGVITGCDAKLAWSTSNEENFSHYELEYSTDGTTFNTVARIESNKNANGSNYSNTSKQNAGKGQYRLKMVDLDGAVEYSKILTLTSQCGKVGVTIYPNPVSPKSGLTVAVNGYGAKIQAMLVDKLGKQVNQFTLVNGNNAVRLGNIASGTYVLIVKDEKGNASNQTVNVVN